MSMDVSKLNTPCYVIDRGLLQANLETLDMVQKRTGCHILLALKGYAAWSTFSQMGEVLCGCAVSSLHEARLSQAYFGKQIHLCAPAFRADEMDDYLSLVDHIVFNSFNQW